MSDGPWFDEIRERQTFLPLPPRSVSVDLTSTLTTLADHGLPATVTSYDTLLLADGRFVRVVLPNRLGPTPDDDVSLTLLSTGPSPNEQSQIAARNRNLLVVDPPRGRVWLDGKRVHKTGDIDLIAVFAVARHVAIHGGDLQRMGEQTGLSADTLKQTLHVLADELTDTALGVEAWRPLDLIDWCIACYPGPGGIRTRWRRDDSLDEQAEDLHASGCVAADRWAGHEGSHGVRSETLTVYAHRNPDMAALGFIPAAVTDDATVEVIVPEDATIFAEAAADGRPGHTGPFTSATTILRAAAYSNEAALVVGTLRSQLHFRADTEHDLRWSLPS
jgi:hypothetical protein